MASEAKDFIDTWTGDADPDAFTPEEEREIIEAGLASVARHGTISHAEAMRRVEDIVSRLRSG